MVFSTLRLTVFASLLATVGCSSIDNEIPKISGYVMPTAALSEGQPVRILVTLADVSKTP